MFTFRTLVLVVIYGVILLSRSAAADDLSTAQVALKKGDRIIFFGDSLTELGGKEEPKKFVTKGYVRLVREKLQESHKDLNIEVDWVATGGHTVPDLLIQKPTVFESQTVNDNLELALKSDRRARAALFWRESPQERDRIDQLLNIIRLTAVRHRLAGSLSHGQRQWLEIGMLLAQEPKLLLVDEPVAGMTDVETQQTAELLKEINRDRTLVVVEHDMAFVRELGVKVTCLHEGSVLAEGTIDQVSANERVVEVYFGR